MIPFHQTTIILFSQLNISIIYHFKLGHILSNKTHATVFVSSSLIFAFLLVAICSLFVQLHFFIHMCKEILGSGGAEVLRMLLVLHYSSIVKCLFDVE